MLRHVPPIADPRVLVDASSRDDAAVFRLSDERALVATTDFFTPIVDDARTWGAIAAANALSDVYAMGAAPLFALQLVGWPRDVLPFDLLGEVLAGAGEVCARAGCPIVGGHSVDDAEPKFGLAVVGEAAPDALFTNAAGRPGDLLVLTKPLGTGILTTALKRGLLAEADLAEAIASMTTLNDGAMRAARAAGVRAATDVTGFGLLGHLRNILAASGVGAEVAVEALPVFPRTLAFAGQGAIPGGTTRNLDAAGAEWDDAVTPLERLLCCDAQTSGGLLLAVPPDACEALLAALADEATPAAAVIGRLTGRAGTLAVRRRLD